MYNLLRIEWLKIKKYPAFWWMLIIVTLTYPGINLMFFKVYLEIANGKETINQVVKMFLGNPFAFPETWHTVAFFSSFFILLPSILVIMLVTNEYNYKTHRQNIIDGWSRSEFITSKLIDVIIIAGVVTFIYILVAVGFGMYADDMSWNRWAEQIKYVPLFFLQTFAQLSIAFLLGYLVKKAFIALGIFLFYFLIVENIIIGFLTWKKLPGSRFLPFEISDKIIVSPPFIGKFGKDLKAGYDEALKQVPAQIGLTILLTAIIWLICYRIHNKRDIA